MLIKMYSESLMETLEIKMRPSLSVSCFFNSKSFFFKASTYSWVSNKCPPCLVIFEFFTTHDTFTSTSAHLLIYAVQIFKNINPLHSSYIAMCQNCKRCRSFNPNLLMNALQNKLNFNIR